MFYSIYDLMCSFLTYDDAGTSESPFLQHTPLYLVMYLLTFTHDKPPKYDRNFISNNF